MKNIINIILFFSILFAIVSCEDMMGDYLEKAPGVDVTEDTIFSSKNQVETFIAATYEQGIHTTVILREAESTGNVSYGLTDAITDEGEMDQTWWNPQTWNVGNVTPNLIIGIEDSRWKARWSAIRRCNILIERIESVPGVSESYIKQVKGEALFIRSLNYFEMLKRYGGVPIVEKRFQLDDDLLLPRNSVEECVDFIVKSVDEAIGYLPDSYSSEYRGRITKGAALILKSRTLLYAASPLFNTATPYLDFGENNKLICYTNNDNNRWKLAATAAKAVIDWAPAGGIYLVEDKGEDMNYRYVWETHDNSEIILANKSVGEKPLWDFPWNGIIPRCLGMSWGGMSVTLNFQKLYEKKDGTPQTWEGGSNLNEKYEELDPRFAQTFAYNGARWNNDIPRIQTYEGGPHNEGCFGGVWVHKRVPYSLSYNRPEVPHIIIFRLAEAYLNYAEALNEAQGPVQEAYDAVNKIRNRSGMPDLPEGLTQEQFRARVQDERAVELAYEEHRFWDLKRWLRAKEVIDADMYGVKIYQEGNDNFSYEPYVFEKRVFMDRMYLHPFDYDEVLKGYLVQNPGY